MPPSNTANATCGFDIPKLRAIIGTDALSTWQVRRWQHKATGQWYALRTVPLKQNVKRANSVLPSAHEIKLLQKLTHTNVVPQIVELEPPHPHQFSIMQVLPTRKTLLDMFDERASPFREHEVIKIAYPLLTALEYCHAQGVIHGDLNPMSVSVTDNGVLQLCDFGGIYNPSLWYFAPEILLGDANARESVDLWSMGCLVAECLTLTPLFQGDCEFGALMQIFQVLGTPNEDTEKSVTELPFFNSQFPKFPPRDLHDVVNLPADSQLMQLLEELLVLNPARRATAKSAVSHAVFAVLKKQKVARKARKQKQREKKKIRAAQEAAQKAAQEAAQKAAQEAAQKAAQEAAQETLRKALREAVQEAAQSTYMHRMVDDLLNEDDI